MVAPGRRHHREPDAHPRARLDVPRRRRRRAARPPGRPRPRRRARPRSRGRPARGAGSRARSACRSGSRAAPGRPWRGRGRSCPRFGEAPPSGSRRGAARSCGPGTRARPRSARPARRGPRSPASSSRRSGSSGRARAGRTRSPACSPQRPALRWASRPSTSFGMRSLVGWSAISASSSDRVGAAVGLEQQVGAVAVGDREVRGARGLRHVVREVARGWRPTSAVEPRVRATGPAAASRAPRTRACRRPASRTSAARALGVRSRPGGRARRARRPRACGARPPGSRDGMCWLDRRAGTCARARSVSSGTSKPLAFARSSAWATWIADVRPRRVAAPPEGEAAVVVLQRAQALDVARHRGRPSPRAWADPRPAKAVEHVAQRGHGEDARGELLGALEGVGHEVEHGVGQGLERGRRGGDLEAAELRQRTGRAPSPAGPTAPCVDLAVGREGLGRGRRPDRQRAPRPRRPSARPRRRPGSAPCPRGRAAAGKRTSTRSLAGTATRRPAPAVERGVARAHAPRPPHRARRSGSAPRPAARSGRRSSGSAAPTAAP